MCTSKPKRRHRFRWESLEHRRVLASITGFAFLDANGDGDRGQEEFGVAGIRLELRDQADDLLEIAVTSDLGFYSFGNLVAGVYSVAAQQPVAMEDGLESSGYAGVQIGTDEITNIELGDADIATEINFGELRMKPGYISPLWVLSSSSTSRYGALLRDTVASAEEAAGNIALASLIQESSPQSLPVATSDRYESIAGEELTVNSTLGLLQNDLNPRGGGLTVELVSQPGNGLASLAQDGSFSYIANSDFFGVDAFTYRAIDESGAASRSATVAIDVAPPPNRAPVGVANVYQVLEDETLIVEATGVLENDIDLEGDVLTALVLQQPTNGSLSLNADGSFQYTPNENFFGSDSFLYIASDGELDSDETQVQLEIVPVNDPPEGSNDAYTTNENETLVIEPADGILANDTDLEGDSLTATLGKDVSNGVLTFVEDGAFTYEPNPGFSGLDSFTYVARDGSDSSAETTVTIDVGSVNDAPVANPDAFSTDEDVTLRPNVSVLENDDDLDGDTLTVELAQEPTNGSITLNSDGTFEYSPNRDFNGEDTFRYVASDGLRSSEPTTVTITVTPTNDAPFASDDQYGINAGETLVISAVSGVLANDTDVESDLLSADLVATPNNGQVVLQLDGSFEYTATAGFVGQDSFTYQANDGISDSNIATVTINVIAVNVPPETTDDSYEVDQNQTLVVSLDDGVLANDADADGNVLTATIDTEPANGTLDFNADGSFTYTPATGFSGTDSFSYVAGDGVDASRTTTVTVNVLAAPVTIVESVSLAASKDNSLFESATGSLSNGVGEYLFVGKTLQSENFLRRGLIAFDFSAIPPGATITDVSLTLNMSRTIVGAFDVTLHRLLRDWGEGSSDAPAEEGTGIDSATGDATWLHTFYDSENWSTPGGDFSAEASAATSVDGVGFYTWNSAEMVADVQGWLDDPSTNAGWLLLMDEVEITAKRFDSREHSNEANRPQLIVEYEVSSGSQVSAARGEATADDAVDVVLASANTPPHPGDANWDGEVTFADFLVLAHHFGSTDSVFAEGDFDGNGRTDFGDFLVLAAKFGNRP